MAEALFYHLTLRSLEVALPELLQRGLQRGWRSVVRCGAEARLEDLNKRLWTYRDDSFLPHGAPGDGHAARQPIYLTTGDETPNQPDLLFLVDGAEASTAELTRFQRVCLIFDGRDDAAVAKARGQWRAITEASVPAIYWAEEPGGKWVKKAEKRPEAG